MVCKSDWMILLGDDTLTDKQKWLLLIWFGDVWGFVLKVNYEVYTIVAMEKFRLLVALSRFYDLSITQLDKIQLWQVANWGDKLWFQNWDLKTWLIFPPVFKQMILELIRDSKKCSDCMLNTCKHGKNTLFTKAAISDIITEYSRIPASYDQSISQNQSSFKTSETSGKVTLKSASWECFNDDSGNGYPISVFSDDKDLDLGEFLRFGFTQHSAQQMEITPVLFHIFKRKAAELVGFHH